MWEIWSMFVVTGLSSPATMLLNRPIRGLLPQINRKPVNNDDTHYEAL